MTITRTVDITPGWDCIGVRPCKFGYDRCVPGGNGSHGRHNAELHLTVTGPTAEILLVLNTGWNLPTVPMNQRVCTIKSYPDGKYIRFHTAFPQYPEQQPLSRTDRDRVCCDWPQCFMDHSFTLADQPAALLVTDGLDAVWAWLKNKLAELSS